MMDTDGGLTDWTHEMVKGRLIDESIEREQRQKEHPVTGDHKPMSDTELHSMIKNMRR